MSAFYGDWSAAVAFCVVIAVVPWMRGSAQPGWSGRTPGSIPWVLLVPLWLIATASMQAFAGMQDITGTRWVTSMSLALAALVIWTAFRFRAGLTKAETADIADAMAVGLLAAGLVGVVAQWTQVFRLEGDTFGLVARYSIPVGRRVWGNLNQPNHQATVEGLALAATIWLAARGRLGVAMWLVVALLLESGIVLSGSRTGLIHVGVAAVFALIAASQAGGVRADSRPLRKPVGLVCAAIAVVVMMPLLHVAIHALADAYGWSLFDAAERIAAGDQVSLRGGMWQHALAMFRAHPWLGVGWGEFAWHQFQQMDTITRTVEMTLHAHNAVLDMLAKTGLVGTGGVVVLLLAWLFRVGMSFLRADAQGRTQTALLLTWLAMLGAHSMLEYPLHYLYFLLPLCFMLGWLEPSGFGRWRLSRAMTTTLPTVFLVGAVAILGTMWQDYRRIELRSDSMGQDGRALPMPAFWFWQYGYATEADYTEPPPGLTREAAQEQLPVQLAATHLLPSPSRIARTAWYLALAGDPATAEAWLARLPIYVVGEQPRQLARLAQRCASALPAQRPGAFCDWIAAQQANRSTTLHQGPAGISAAPASLPAQ
jgi:O-antigen ligase